MNKVTRCSWVSEDPLYQKYHDEEWGRPVLDSQLLFAKLCLEGQQAGLSWITVLKKQKNYEAAFFNFVPSKIVEMTEEDIELLMTDAGLIRHRLKLNAIVKNAKAYLLIQEELAFSDYIWAFTEGKTIRGEVDGNQEECAAVAKKMSKDLKKRGFTFVGETICYAFMQAVGIVNDHAKTCFCYQEVSELARK